MEPAKACGVTCDVKELETALDELSLNLLKPCLDLVPDDSLVIPPHIASSIFERMHSSSKMRLLHQLALLAKTKTQCAGAGVYALGKSGTIYLAHTVSFEDLPPQTFISPMQFLTAVARHHNETDLRQIAFSEESSGTDRDFLRELSLTNCTLYISQKEHDGEIDPKVEEPLSLASQIQLYKLNEERFEEEFQGLATSVAYDSHSPLTKALFGIVVLMKDGKIYPGSYIETRGKTCLNPLQYALSLLLADNRSFSEIQRVMYAESYKTRFSLEDRTDELLKVIAPNVKLEKTQF